jgi:hypothetical protein
MLLAVRYPLFVVERFKRQGRKGDAKLREEFHYLVTGRYSLLITHLPTDRQVIHRFSLFGFNCQERKGDAKLREGFHSLVTAATHY